jgi:hypothetical protein
MPYFAVKCDSHSRIADLQLYNTKQTTAISHITADLHLHWCEIFKCVDGLVEWCQHVWRVR